MNKYCLYLAILLLALKGCHQGSDKSLEDMIIQNCSQHPINLFMEEHIHETRLYKLGEKDQEFRDILTELSDRYLQNGEDLSRNQVISLAYTYVPRYLNTCQKFFMPVKQECAQFHPESKQFDQCLAPYNESYKNQFEEQFNLVGAGVLDIDTIRLTPLDQS